MGDGVKPKEQEKLDRTLEYDGIIQQRREGTVREGEEENACL